jgi:hypothetical protein
MLFVFALLTAPLEIGGGTSDNNRNKTGNREAKVTEAG